MYTDGLVPRAQADSCLVTCYVGPAHDLYHLSNVLTGFIELAAAGRVEFRLEPAAEAIGQPLQSAAIQAQVTSAGLAIDVAFDVYDRSDVFETALLESCGLYFKRSFYRPDIDRLPRSLQPKVIPLGMNYGCRSARGESLLLESGLRLDETLNRYRSVLAFEEFERGPNVAAEPSIVFQTRAWAPESTSDNVEEVNESRARVIRALRRAFPHRFQGGFVANLFAQQRYPDLLTVHSDELSQYARFSKAHLIGISTRGLHHSMPFKLSEYLAASLAIVSEPVRNELPAAFADGRNFLEFHTPEECLEKCDRILSDPALAAALREASWRYYQAEVRPARHMANVLERALRYLSTRQPAM